MSNGDRSGQENAITYVPGHQKREWKAHADELGMSLSEYLRTMVQSGRRGFLDTDSSEPVEEGPAGGSNPGGEALETTIQEILRQNEVTTWEELVETVSDDIEARIETVLEDLQSANRIKHSPRENGYVYLGDDDGS